MQILHVLEPDCHFARNIAVDDAFMPRRYRLIVFCVASLGGVARAQSIEPVAAYAFSEGSGTAIADVSENDNGGVLTTGASWTRGGRFGNGLVLAGGTQGVSVGGASALDVASGLTVEAWICPSSVAGYPKIAWRDGADGSPFNLAMAFGNGTLVFNVLTTAGRFSAFAYESLVANAWTHVAATYDGTALRVYLDGVLAGSMPASGAVVPSTGDLWLGRAPWGEGFTGGFDEVRIYDRALPAEEIARDRDTQVNGLDPPDVGKRSPAADAMGIAPSSVIGATFSKSIDPATLTGGSFYLTGPSGNVAATIAYDAAAQVATLSPSVPLATLTSYTVHITTDVGDLDEGVLRAPVTWTFTTSPDPALTHAAYAFSAGSGSSAADSSANGNTAVLTRADLWTAAGRHGNGLLLDGGTDGARIGASASLDLTPGITLEAWIYPTSVAGYPKLIWRDGLNGSPYNLGMAWGNGSIGLGITTSAGSFSVFAYRAVVANSWTHVAATYDGSALRIFLDGQLVNSTPANGSIVASTRELWLGRAPWGEGMNGTLDEVRIYNRALSEDEIRADMMTSIDDVTPPTVTTVVPSSGATGVSPTATLMAVFSEPLAPRTVTKSTFMLTDAANAVVAASVSYNGATHAATLTPDAALAGGTTYTLTVRGGSAGINDVAGNPLAADYSWSFTTMEAPPTVTGITPAAGATDVNASTEVVATFSKDMASASISTSTFELRNEAGLSVQASVSYSAATRTATLHPSSPLGSAVYTAVVKGGWAGVKDLAGHALASDYAWSFTSTNSSAPTITATFSPPPNAAGWNTGNVTATFTCADDEGIAVCTPPLQVTGEGARIPVTGTATDTKGNSTTKTWYVNIDKTGPVVHVYYPANGSNLPAATTPVVIRGGAFDVSGVDVVTCAGLAATLTAGVFACAVDAANGRNTVPIQAADLVGRVTATSVTFTVGDPTVTSLEISPGSTVMFAGDSREIYVKDQNGNEVHQGTWSVSDPSIAAIAEADNVTTLAALGAGMTDVSVTYSGHTARATVTVYPAGTDLPRGTTLWSLNDNSGLGAPKRGKVLRAASTGDGDGDPNRAPALFFVDEGTEWSADTLTRFFDRPTRIRTTSADGRQLSQVSFAGRVPQQIAADYNDGVIVVLPSSGSLPSTVQRFDGRSGQLSWEHVAVAGFLTDAAIHPDGTVYISEFHITGSTFFVSIAPDGSVTKYPLPQGRFQQVDAGTCGFNQAVKTPAHVSHPIIREDGTVVFLAHLSDAMRFVSSFVTDEFGHCSSRTLSQSATQSAFAIELSDGAMSVHALDIASWDIPDQTLEQQQLLPDGHDGLLVVDRKRPSVIRVDAEYRVAAKNNQLVPNDATRYYETEYVLGEDAAYAVMNSYVFFNGSGNAYRSRVMSFDPQTLQTLDSPTDLGTPMTAPQHIRLRFALSGGGIYAAGPAAAYVVNATIDTSGFAMGGNASPIVAGIWGGWSGTPTTQFGSEPIFATTVWRVPTIGDWFGANSMSARPLTTDLLRQTAVAQGIGAAFPDRSIQQNREIGLAFQDFALWSVSGSAYANTTPKPSVDRVRLAGIQNVIPDGMGTVRYEPTSVPSSLGGPFIDYPNSGFQEVKAVKGTLTMNYPKGRYQIAGLVDVADRSPLGQNTPIWPTLTFLTTADTNVGLDVLVTATARGVQIHQRRASLLPGGFLRMDWEVPLNWSLSRVIVGQNGRPWSGWFTTRIARLGEHPGAPPAVDDPDPLPDPEP